MELANITVGKDRITAKTLRPILAGSVGAAVTVAYEDIWRDMDTKTLVWRAGEVIRDDTKASGVIPAEVLQTPGLPLDMGVYGTRGETATPTRWVCLGIIMPGAEPSGDESTHPGLPVWAQLSSRIEGLEGPGIAKAVAAYLEENPLEAGATAEEAAQIQKNRQDIEQLSADKLDAAKLSQALSDGLAQAKASGEFKGDPGEKGEKGDAPVRGTDYWTEADRAEIKGYVDTAILGGCVVMSVKEKMTAIADAIRGKTGSTGKLTLDAMASAIAGMETGGGSALLVDETVTLVNDVAAAATSNTIYQSDKLANLRWYFALLVKLDPVLADGEYEIVQCSHNIDYPGNATRWTGSGYSGNHAYDFIGILEDGQVYVKTLNVTTLPLRSGNYRLMILV